MKPKLLLGLAFVLCSSCTMTPPSVRQSAGGLPATGQTDLAAIHRTDWPDWRRILESPEAEHDPNYGKFVEVLKHSLVPTEQDAITRAMSAGGGVDARTTWQVSALLRLASAGASQPNKDFGQAGDFVWEVRVLNRSTFGGVHAVVWVSTTTGKTRILIATPDSTLSVVSFQFIGAETTMPQVIATVGPTGRRFVGSFGNFYHYRLGDGTDVTIGADAHGKILFVQHGQDTLFGDPLFYQKK